MRKTSKTSDLIGIDLDSNVINAIKEQLNILDENYGVERNIDTDLWGYVLILESKDDVIKAREDVLDGVIPEYTDIIECKGDKQYCLSLFLLSSDYAVIVISSKELMDRLIEN